MDTNQPRQIAAFGQKHRTGLVTLVFTDLVGSTELKQRHGDATALGLIEHHHAVVRDLLRSIAGAEEISTADDSFFLAFARPSDAVRFGLRCWRGCGSWLARRARRCGTGWAFMQGTCLCRRIW